MEPNCHDQLGWDWSLRTSRWESTQIEISLNANCHEFDAIFNRTIEDIELKHRQSATFPAVFIGIHWEENSWLHSVCCLDGWQSFKPMNFDSWEEHREHSTKNSLITRIQEHFQIVDRSSIVTIAPIRNCQQATEEANEKSEKIRFITEGNTIPRQTTESIACRTNKQRHFLSP
jgi:hypothetical protein